MTSPQWIDVADDAVKVGLGALIAAGAGFLTVSVTRKNDQKKHYYENRMDLLKEAVLEVSTFGSTVSTYWARFCDAVYRRDTHQKSTDAQKKELADLEKKSFDGFTNASTPRAKLSMLGEHDARIAMDNLVKTCDIFFKMADLTDPNCTQDLLDTMKKEIASARENFFQEIEKAFNKEI